MDYQNRYGGHALVIGASTTVGEQFARQLAAKGMNVLLVARRAALLEELAESIRRDHGVDATPVVLDLLAEGAFDQLLERIAQYEVGFLVVNANLHKVGLFQEMDLQTKLKMVHMNVTLPLIATEHIGKAMVERGRGGIVYVNALNCLAALEIDGVFQGTKAFLLLFGESLWAEYSKHGVHVAVTLVNGIEGSESYENKLSPLKRRLAKVIGGSMAPSEIVRKTLEAHERGRPVIVPDFDVPINKLGYDVGLLVRLTKSRALTRGWSRVFEWLLDGDEVRAGAGKA